MLNKDDYIFFQHYKRRPYIAILSILPVGLPIIIACLSYYKYPLYPAILQFSKIVLIIDCVLLFLTMLIEFLALRAYVFLFNMFFMIFIVSVNWFISGLLLLNLSLIHWDPLNTSILIVYFLISSIIPMVLEIKKWDSYKKQLIEDGIIEEEKYYNILREFRSPKYHNNKKLAIVFIVFFLIFFVYVISQNKIESITLPSRKSLGNAVVFAGFLMVVIPYVINLYYCGLPVRGALIHKYEVLYNKRFYTTLKKIYDHEVEINDLRAKKGLQPVNLSSPFYLGDINES